MQKLSYKGLILALGFTWAIYLLFNGWVAIGGWATELVNVMGSYYIGYGPTFLGGIIGGIWGFIDGAIAGFLIALFYNKFIAK